MDNFKCNQSEILYKIESKTPFRCNTVTGLLIDDFYLVFSYGTLIYKIHRTNPYKTYFNDTYYSRTTSKLQNIIKRYIHD
ncbi:hypothetical protein [Campylobacter fetus]|uniref:hypothetical protein n=1 Tax=Campylobacter fetus TaxID=196 RepID=UPI000FCCD9B5|nr:hypothetical protein [Campylobacter fetus]RUT50954.1 hypothetical protein BWK67_00075 [Campylobacter fetus]